MAGAYNFKIGGIVAGAAIFIDPQIAVGYKYTTGVGNLNFAAVLLPAVQNNPYDLSFDYNGKLYVDLLAPETWFDFPAGGVDAFTVLGINPGAMLNPRDTTAFITGLQFEGSGSFTGTMVPITRSVPEPASSAVLGMGLLGIIVIRRRHFRQSAAETLRKSNV